MKEFPERDLDLHTVADYTETYTHFLLQAHLSLMGYPDFEYIIEPISQLAERTEGYDVFVEFDELFTFYMQLKRPSAYLKSSTSNIVTDRDKVGLKSNPYSLYFNLHRSKSEVSDKLINAQHNAMFDMTQRGFRVAYICPLFLFKNNYKFKMRLLKPSASEILVSQLPFEYSQTEILTKAGNPFTFQDVPMFRNHISIPPHDTIDDEVHRYSFSYKGDEVCFHSPLNLEELGKPLYRWLNSVYEDSLQKGFNPNSPEASNKYNSISQIIRNWSSERPDFSEKPDFEAWKYLGDVLSKSFGIEQYGIFRRKKFVESFRHDINTLFGA